MPSDRRMIKEVITAWTIYAAFKMTITEGGGSGMDWESGVSRCKLRHVEWVAMRSCCTAQGTLSSLLGWNMMEDNMKKECINRTKGGEKMHTCKNNLIPMLYSGKKI